MSKRYPVPPPLVVLNCPDPPPTFDPPLATTSYASASACPPTRKIVLYQGWMSRGARAWRTWCAALAARRRRVVVFMGYGDYQVELVEMAAAGPAGRVHFHPRRAPARPARLLRLSRRGVIPYQAVDLNNYYTSPNKLFDLIQAALPIVASDCPFLRKVIVADNWASSRGSTAPRPTPRRSTACSRLPWPTQPNIRGQPAPRVGSRGTRGPPRARNWYEAYSALSSLDFVTIKGLTAPLQHNKEHPHTARAHQYRRYRRALARAQRDLGFDATSVQYVANKYAFDTDRTLNLSRDDSPLKKMRHHRRLRPGGYPRLRVFHLYFGNTLFPYPYPDLPVCAPWARRSYSIFADAKCATATSRSQALHQRLQRMRIPGLPGQAPSQSRVGRRHPGIHARPVRVRAGALLMPGPVDLQSGRRARLAQRPSRMTILCDPARPLRPRNKGHATTSWTP